MKTDKSWTKLCSLLHQRNMEEWVKHIIWIQYTPFNRTASPWTSIVECACSIELVLIFQKALQSNVITSVQLSQGRVIGFHPGTLYQAQEKRVLPENSFVVQTLVSAAGKGKAGIWNLRRPSQLWQALSGNPPSCCSKVVGSQTLFRGFRLFCFILSVKHLQRHLFHPDRSEEIKGIVFSTSSLTLCPTQN